LAIGTTIVNTPNGGFRARRFNGLTDYVEIADHSSLHMSTAVTMIAWINPSDLSVRGMLFNKVGDDYILDISQVVVGQVGIFFEGVSGGWLYSDINLSIGRWVQVAAVWDGSDKFIYINRAERGTEAGVGTIVDDGNSLNIGSASLAVSPINGIIDNVQLYNRGLSENEIFAFFDSSRRIYGT